MLKIVYDHHLLNIDNIVISRVFYNLLFMKKDFLMLSYTTLSSSYGKMITEFFLLHRKVSADPARRKVRVAKSAGRNAGFRINSRQFFFEKFAEE